MPYAENTTVAVSRSRDEIERTLTRYGATAFMYGWNEAGAVVQFAAQGRQIRFDLPLPQRNERRFTHLQPRASYLEPKERTPAAAEKEWEQACRQRWRALALVVKAKLEAVESGISVFEDEFLAHIVLPDGSTVGEWMRPQLAAAYEKKAMPQTLRLELTTGDH